MDWTPVRDFFLDFHVRGKPESWWNTKRQYEQNTKPTLIPHLKNKWLKAIGHEDLAAFWPKTILKIITSQIRTFSLNN